MDTEKQAYQIIGIHTLSFYLFLFFGSVVGIRVTYLLLEYKIEMKEFFGVSIGIVVLMAFFGILLTTHNTIYYLDNNGIKGRTTKKGLLSFPRQIDISWKELQSIFIWNQASLSVKKSIWLYHINRNTIKLNKSVFHKDDFTKMTKALYGYQDQFNKDPNAGKMYLDTMMQPKIMKIMGAVTALAIVFMVTGILHYGIENIIQVSVFCVPFALALSYWIKVIKTWKR